MTKSKLEEVRKLPQTNETWHCGLREMPAWVEEDGRHFRPFVGLIATEEEQILLGQEMWPVPATAEQVYQFLLNCMLEPIMPEIQRSRPRRIYFNDAAIADKLQDRLLALNIQVRSFPTLPIIDFILEQMGEYLEEEGMGGGFPSLVKIPGVDEQWLKEYFTAAANYARKKPWQFIDDSEPIAVRFPAGGPERYVVIMGHGEETYGLATYANKETLALTYSGAPPGIAVQYGPLLSVLLDEKELMAFSDLDAITYHRWPVAGPEAYPAVLKYVDTEEEVVSPTLVDLVFLAACLRIAPTFIRKYLVTRKGLRASAQHTFTLPAIYQKQKIEFSYPVDLDTVPQTIIEESAFNFIDELTSALESGQISPEDIDLKIEDLNRLRLLNFISEWDFREDQLPLVISMGTFMLAFADFMINQELLTNSTVDSHMENTLYIGDFILEDEHIIEFVPQDIFLQEPQYIEEFKEQASSAKTRVASYERTWRKLGWFATSVNLNA